MDEEKGNEVSGQQAAQPAPASDKGAQPAGSTLSPDFIQRLVEDTVVSALSTYEKRQQSERDKMEARIAKRLTAYETTFKSLVGQDLTPEQRSQLRNRAAEEVISEIREAQKEPSQAQPAQAAAKTEEPDPLERLILRKFQKAGVTIEDGDPEVDELLRNINPEDLDDLKEKIDLAIEKKKTRLQKNTSTLAPETAAGRVSAAAGSSGMAGNPIANITDPTELLRMGLSKKK